MPDRTGALVQLWMHVDKALTHSLKVNDSFDSHYCCTSFPGCKMDEALGSTVMASVWPAISASAICDYLAMPSGLASHTLLYTVTLQSHRVRREPELCLSLLHPLSIVGIFMQLKQEWHLFFLPFLLLLIIYWKTLLKFRILISESPHINI